MVNLAAEFKKSLRRVRVAREEFRLLFNHLVEAREIRKIRAFTNRYLVMRLLAR
jgi:hypothetical protein